PRFVNGQAVGFPQTFDVLYSDGTNWIKAQSYANVPAPHGNDWVILPLPMTVMSDGIQIVASTLGARDATTFGFDLAEATGGYHPGYAELAFAGNDGSGGMNRIDNVGSESVDRGDQFGNWNFDHRGIVVDPQPGIY